MQQGVASRRAKRRKRKHAPARRVRARPVLVEDGPTVFSMEKNPLRMNRFWWKLKSDANEGRQVFINLQHIQDLTLDAVGVLTARTQDFNYGVGGSVPDDVSLHPLLWASGFFKHMSNASDFPERPEWGRGLTVRGGVRADAEVCQLVREALVGDDYIPGLYQILMECMSNTHDHATSTDPVELQIRDRIKWWVCAYRPQGSNIAQLAFVDNGVGIIESLREQRDRMPKPWFWPHNDADVMKAAFEGTIESSTFQPERGMGLPGMMKLVQDGLLRNMVVISNGVMAKLDQREFRRLEHRFDGTVLKWEIQL